MAIIEVANLRHALPGGRVLFEDVSFRVGNGGHAALVGANGSGKSTLLRLICGEEKVQSGGIRVDGRAGVMRQFVRDLNDDATLRDFMIDFAPDRVRHAAAELRAAETALSGAGAEHRDVNTRYAAALAGWGEAQGYENEVLWDMCSTAALHLPFDLVADRSIHTFSGGEQKRLALEALFRSDFDVLLLDEPDNFLDIEGKHWLEEMLNASTKTILYVSHDRALLANTSQRVVTLEAAGAWTHPDSFATYYDARSDRIGRIEEERRRYREERQRLYDSMKEFKRRAAISPKFASRAQASETKLKRYEERNAPPERPGEQDIRMHLKGGRTGKLVLRVRDLAIPGIVEAFTTEIYFGERVGVVGPNGSGKSHFLRLLAGENIRHEGAAVLGARVVPGFFSQLHDRPDLAERTLLEVLMSKGLERGASMARLRRYELQDGSTIPFGLLSGGQQARFQILLIETEAPTMLLLDEPTDNLDVDSAEALEAALSDYEGTVLAVTHDRWFMYLLDRFLIFNADGTVRESLVSPYV